MLAMITANQEKIELALCTELTTDLVDSSYPSGVDGQETLIVYKNILSVSHNIFSTLSNPP